MAFHYDIKPAQEFLGLFKKKEPPKEEETFYYQIDKYTWSEFAKAVKDLDEEKLNAVLSTHVKKMHKAQDLLMIYKQGVVPYLQQVTQLIKKWEAIDKFEWHDEIHDPVDENGQIRIPALVKAISDAGAVARKLKPIYEKVVQSLKNNENEGTLQELGYSKQNLTEIMKAIFLMFEEDQQNKWGHLYITAEDHSDGCNYAVNHVIREFWDNPDAYPDLKTGYYAFLDATSVITLFQFELSKIMRPLEKQTGVEL